ncbi:MAG TPA: TIGR02710 family CRISPR-associated CARF protein [Phycisphaerales bacterium]|nr:TIGR02710 family CRISPR-associated CARF protein [Phycisphaerales bacterium]HRQ74548.1 TIGR02710 family CRISPR-associated CARF protein [Phycisphaerales bacterium]
MTHAPEQDRQHILFICSVGGANEPVVQSLLHWRPAAVRFVVSEQTKPKINEILQACTEHPISSGSYEHVDVDDPENLTSAVASLRSLTAHVHRWVKRGSNYRVVVDFTGGTKCMSAALPLVAHRWPCKFSYVGGSRRTKDGVGIVESGSERVVQASNPWEMLGYQVVEEAVTVFNQGGYAAAAALLDRAVRATDDPSVKRELSTLKALINAYAAWDRFDHKTAKQQFDDAIRNRNDLSAIFAEAQPLITQLKRHREQVHQLSQAGDLQITWVEDLLQNARRRAAEHRFDDAVARLYRAIEALAQIRLRDKHGVTDTKSVPLDKVPPQLRSQWSARARNGSVMLGLRDAYTLLAALNDPLGCDFNRSDLANDEKSPLGARNNSILAHGFQPVGQPVYNHLHQCLCALYLFGNPAVHEWSLPATC